MLSLMPGGEHWQLEVFQICRLPHYVRARQVVTALLQYLHQGLCETVPGNVQLIVNASSRVVLLHPSAPLFRGGVAPLSIGRVL
jgi:hypothetical protein